MSHWVRILGTLLWVVLFPSLVSAQGLSGNRPMRIIVPVAPGGPSDTAVRLILPKLSESLGRTLVVDNRPSSNGVAGTDIAAKAAPDGSTINVGNSGTHAINASLYGRIPYDHLRDFIPISQLVTSGMVLVVNPRVAANSLPDFVALAKKERNKLNMGVAGATGEIAGEALMSQAQIRLNNVRYKGSSPTEFAVLSGEVDASILTPLATVGHLASGRMRALGVTSAQRSPVLPNVPTLAELGLQDFDMQIWHGLFAPAKTPDSVIRAVHKGALHALAAPEVKERFTQLGFVIIGSTPEAFAAVVRKETEKFRKVITTAGIKVE